MKEQTLGLDLRKDEDDDLLHSPAFETLVKTIEDFLLHEVDVLENNDISFSAQDDTWDRELQQNLGFSLSTYQKKWQRLKTVQVDGGLTQRGSVRLSDSVTLCTSQAEFILRRQVYEYMHSFPLDDAYAKNHRLHGDCHRVLTGVKLPGRELEILAAGLRYRLTIIRCITDYKDGLGLTSPDCHRYDVDVHRANLTKDPRLMDLYSANYDAVLKYELSDRAVGDEWHDYNKGTYYLAAIMAESGWDSIKVESGLAQLAQIRSMLTLNNHLL